MSLRRFTLSWLLWLLGATFAPASAQVIIHTPEFHPRYQKVAEFKGDVLDFNSEAVVYKSKSGELVRYDLESHLSTVCKTNAWQISAKLIPNGLLLYQNWTEFGAQVVQWENGTETVLGLDKGVSIERGERVIDGRFGVLHTPAGAILRDFVARTNFVFPGGLDFYYGDVAPNGQAAFTTWSESGKFEVHRLRDGQVQKVATVESGYPPYAATDGTNLLWTAMWGTIMGEVHLETPGGSLLLDARSAISQIGESPANTLPNRNKLSAMQNGWLIFPKFRTTPGVYGFEVWRREPAGELQMIGFAPSFIKSLREDGAALLTSPITDGSMSGGIYFVPPTGQRKFISGDFHAWYFAAKKDFYAIAFTQNGMGLFRVIVEGEPFGLMRPAVDPQRGIFSYQIHASVPGTYFLERSEDGATWFELDRNEVAATLEMPRFEVRAGPGLFRLRRAE
jgi:hypothetical protein